MKLVKRLYLLLLLVLAGVGCGDIADQASMLNVVGGRQPKADDPILKHLVRLELYYKDGNSGLCTGTLISKVHVLTAAHCVKNLMVAAAMFGSKFDRDTEIKREDIRMSRWFYANDFLDVTTAPGLMKDAIKNKTFIKDIAVIRLEKEAPDGYEPVRLEDVRHLPQTSRIGAEMLGGGYGANMIPKAQAEERERRKKEFEESEKEESDEGIVKSGPITIEQAERLLEEREEQESLDTLDPGSPNPGQESANGDEDPDFKVGSLVIMDDVYFVHDSAEVGEFIVANPIDMDRAVCMGDSGGPIFINVEVAPKTSIWADIFGAKSGAPVAVTDKWILMGVASRSDCEQMSIYTDVAQYVSWLEDEAVPAVDALFESGEEESSILATEMIPLDIDLSGLNLELGKQ